MPVLLTSCFFRFHIFHNSRRTPFETKGSIGTRRGWWIDSRVCFVFSTHAVASGTCQLRFVAFSSRLLLVQNCRSARYLSAYSVLRTFDVFFLLRTSTTCATPFAFGDAPLMLFTMAHGVAQKWVRYASPAPGCSNRFQDFGVVRSAQQTHSPAARQIVLLGFDLVPGEKEMGIDSGRPGATGPPSSRIFFVVKGCRYIGGTKLP